MKSTSHLTKEQMRELMFQPLSKEAGEQFHEIDKSHKWLLVLNLQEMDREENEPDDEKED